MTITLPPELEESLRHAAGRARMSVEEFVVDRLKYLFPPAMIPGSEAVGAQSLYDEIKEFIGSVQGTGEVISLDPGELEAVPKFTTAPQKRVG